MRCRCNGSHRVGAPAAKCHSPRAMPDGTGKPILPSSARRKMNQTAQPEHGHQIAADGHAIPQRIKRREAGRT